MSRKVIIVFVLAFVVLALAMTCGVSFASQKAAKASSALDTANAAQLQNGPIKWVVIKKTPKATFDTEYAKVKKLGYTRKSWDTARVAMNTWFKKSKKGQGWILPNTKEKALTDPAGLVVPTEKTPYEI
ncbi:MAG: hypothetical protein PHU86_03185, partial [Patescibacteria group bacterium]|nr:hypothetical protein [Patescibacteria group bacterium]